MPYVLREAFELRALKLFDRMILLALERHADKPALSAVRAALAGVCIERAAVARGGSGGDGEGGREPYRFVRVASLDLQPRAWHHSSTVDPLSLMLSLEEASDARLPRAFAQLRALLPW